MSRRLANTNAEHRDPHTPTTVPIYHTDLAHIHVVGYDFHWQGAAPAVLRWLADAGIIDGRVVDLGCGGGQRLARLDDEGYEAVGIDGSAEMIGIARRNAPRAELITGSFDQVDIPSCRAITSLGEPINYLNSRPRMQKVLKKTHRALEPGGLFVFDVRQPPTKPVAPVERHRSGDDWFCHSLTEEDHRSGAITRHITSFVRTKADRYRRSHEVHRLKVFPREEVAEWLRDLGFRVRMFRGYGEYRLGPRQTVYVCRKAN